LDNPRALLLVGVSTRALAASVRRSGYRGALRALDFFADTDHPRRCACLALGRDIGGPPTTAKLLRSAIDLAPGVVAFSGGMENHPGLLARLEECARVLGNGSRSVRALRNPRTFLRFLARHSLPHPRTWLLSEPAQPLPVAAVRLARSGRLLWKPRHGGGGVRIRTVAAKRPSVSIGRLPRRGYLQEVTHGVAGSASFVADGRHCRLLGFCQALRDPAVLGTPGHAYGGSLWGPVQGWLPLRARRLLEHAAQAATQDFGLRGLNGIDFMLAGGTPHILEINPRYTASMELIEEAWGRSLFALHRHACERGSLPETSGEATVVGSGARWRAKGVLYAVERMIAGPAEPLLRMGARDVPRAGTLLRKGWPVCTLVATATDAVACREVLRRRARRLRQVLGLHRRMRPAS
jgi:predicted ATP-grasp superfamily ATP-dependent carboligase